MTVVVFPYHYRVVGAFYPAALSRKLKETSNVLYIFRCCRNSTSRRYRYYR